MKYKSVKGMEDILPSRVEIWQWLENTARKDLESYGYNEIRTPILEDTSIFVRSIGQTADIVTKEMYTFTDKKGRSLTLRPEGTAPIVRAYIEHSLDKISQIVRLYYVGPMFRSERPQKGRSRQFHQIGVEVFGTSSPYADIELIMQLNNMLKLFGLKDFTIKLNSLGCKTDQDKFADKLRNYLEDKKNRLCQDCKDRMKRNVLRVLDCKDESCIQVVREAPNTLETLCHPCEDHLDKVKASLEKMNIEIKEAKNLVRGLDYYTGTVFEIAHPALGSQDAIAAGGRYDNLVKDLGGSSVGAVGYAMGIERVMFALKEEIPTSKDVHVIYIATLGDCAKIHGIQIAEKIRNDPSLTGKVIALTDITEASLKSQMRFADKNGARVVLIMGQDEVVQGKVIIKDMAGAKGQIYVDKNSVIGELQKRLC